MIGPLVAEIFEFENVYAQTHGRTNGRRIDRYSAQMHHFYARKCMISANEIFENARGLLVLDFTQNKGDNKHKTDFLI